MKDFAENKKKEKKMFLLNEVKQNFLKLKEKKTFLIHEKHLFRSFLCMKLTHYNLADFFVM